MGSTAYELCAFANQAALHGGKHLATIRNHTAPARYRETNGIFRGTGSPISPGATLVFSGSAFGGTKRILLSFCRGLYPERMLFRTRFATLRAETHSSGQARRKLNELNGFTSATVYPSSKTMHPLLALFPTLLFRPPRSEQSTHRSAARDVQSGLFSHYSYR